MKIAAIRAACAQPASRADDRPVLAEVLAALTRGEADAVVVLKLERLSRSVVDAGRLLEGVRRLSG